MSKLQRLLQRKANIQSRLQKASSTARALHKLKVDKEASFRTADELYFESKHNLRELDTLLEQISFNDADLSSQDPATRRAARQAWKNRKRIEAARQKEQRRYDTLNLRSLVLQMISDEAKRRYNSFVLREMEMDAELSKIEKDIDVELNGS